MRNLERNKREFTYCLYTGKTALTDTDGYETGEYKITYSEPITARGHISMATGQSNTEQFGNLDNYDKVLAIEDVNTPIDTDTVFFIDKPYEADEDGNPIYDYIVRRVAVSLNQVSIALMKVEVRQNEVPSDDDSPIESA